MGRVKLVHCLFPLEHSGHSTIPQPAKSGNGRLPKFYTASQGLPDLKSVPLLNLQLTSGFPGRAKLKSFGVARDRLGRLNWIHGDPTAKARLYIYSWLQRLDHLLVGDLNPSEKYEFVNWDDDIPNISGKIQKMATKPPTSLYLWNISRKSWGNSHWSGASQPFARPGTTARLRLSKCRDVPATFDDTVAGQRWDFLWLQVLTHDGILLTHMGLRVHSDIPVHWLKFNDASTMFTSHL